MSQNGDADSSPAPTKPVPREPKSAAQLAQIQRHNRRREYLQRNPAYFDNLDHELADPILYQRLIKQFQSAAQRQSEGQAKGYGRTLEADLVRGETRLQEANPARSSGGSSGGGAVAQTGPVVDRAWDRAASSREDGRELWRAFLQDRFVRGGDEDFEYAPVDANEDYDDVARKDAQDAWFEDEGPGWEAAAGPSVRQGETGVQDF